MRIPSACGGEVTAGVDAERVAGQARHRPEAAAADVLLCSIAHRRAAVAPNPGAA